MKPQMGFIFRMRVVRNKRTLMKIQTLLINSVPVWIKLSAPILSTRRKIKPLEATLKVKG